MNDHSNEPRSLLFVPGTREERIGKAVAAGADLVCIDLEDAVPPDDKTKARKAVLTWLQKGQRHVGVRVNGLTTAEGVADVHALIESRVQPAFVMVPKVEHEETLRLYSHWLAADTHIIPIVETARGLERASEIFAEPGVQQGLFGGVDYSADVGCDLGFEGLLAARTRLLNAAASSRVTLFDTPYTNVRDLDGLADEIHLTRKLGMRARAAIHPDQVSVIHKALMPTEEERENARRIIAAYDAAGGRAALLDGKLIELPVIKSARRILAMPADE